MEKKHSDIEKEVQKTLESLDSVSRATPKPFFYTRLEAQLDKGHLGVGRFFDMLTQPKYALSTAALLVLAVLNVTFIIQQVNPQDIADTSDDLESVTVSEYEALASLTVFYPDEGEDYEE
ncbi:MAG: hypothetical protein ED557_12175 [Balneola sp.]|nr:MAG: hypothetical protein ED557_12175 [Balneola sp.]